MPELWIERYPAYAKKNFHILFKAGYKGDEAKHVKCYLMTVENGVGRELLHMSMLGKNVEGALAMLRDELGGGEDWKAHR